MTKIVGKSFGGDVLGFFVANPEDVRKPKLLSVELNKYIIL